MHDIDITSVDLNLLTALDALLAEGSVSRAATRLRIGQPAASHALSRLRQLFGDPLLVRSGRAMVPTPRAEALREPLQRLLADAARLMRQEVTFEPKVSTRSFRLIAPDLLATLLPPVIAQIGREAPRARLEVTSRALNEAAALEDGRADVALVPAMSEGPGLRARGLGTIRFGVVARRSHPAIVRGRKLAAKAWVSYPHVMVRSGSSSRSFVSSAVERAGVERHIALVVPNFLSALVAVAETNLFFTAPQQLVGPVAARFDLVVVPPPIPVPEIPVAAVWHERYDAEPGHRFFRSLIIDELAAALAARVGT